MALQPYYPPWIQAGQTKLEDVGADIVNSFAKGAALNIQKENLQRQREQLEALEQYRALEMAQKDRQFRATMEYHKGELDVSRGNLELRGKEYNQKRQDVLDAQDSLSGFTDALGKIDKDSHTADSDFWQAATDNVEGYNTAGGRAAARAWWQRHNANAKVKETSMRHDLSSWANLTKSQVPDAQGNLDIFASMDNWQPVYKDYDKKTGKGIGEPTDDITIALRNPSDPTKPPAYVTRPKSFVRDKVSQYKAFTDQLRTLPQQQNVPGLGVYAQPPDDHPAAAPQPPKRAPGVYKDAQGNRARYNADGTWTPL